MTLNQLTWRLIFPLAIISFATVTKWWYVLPVDAPDTMMAGFPLAFVSDGWHTSMSLQIFVLGLVVDFVIYFLFWFVLIFSFDRFLKKINMPKLLIRILWVFSIIIFAFATWVATFPEQIIQTKRTWEMKVLETGYKFTWTHQDRPDFIKYDTKKQ